MHHALWFLVGCAVTLLLGLIGLRMQRLTETDWDEEEGVEEEAPSPARPLIIANSHSLSTLANGLGKDLSSLATGVEGHAQLLCESLGDPQRTNQQAEQLCEAVRRLRFFSEKMLSFAPVRGLAMQPVDIKLHLQSLAMEVRNYSGGGLQVGLYTAPSLPMAMAEPDSLRIALLFLIEGLLCTEPGATTLSLHAYTELEGDQDALVRIEIEAENDEPGQTTHWTSPGKRFSYLAARNLLEAHDAKLALEHKGGESALASLTLRATYTPDTLEELEPLLPVGADSADQAEELAGLAHSFGGVLIMECNPSIRDLLAREVRNTNRNVIACADSVAAQTLFQATPERFELLILEQDSRRLAGDEVAAKAMQLNPDLKVILLTSGPGWVGALPERLGDSYKLLSKPFGVMELRESLAEILGPRPELGLASSAHEGQS